MQRMDWSSDYEGKPTMIYLEPRNIYDQAIIGYKNDIVIYCFWSIVDALMETGWTEINAIDHICYNIQGTSMRGWPIIIENNNNYP